MGLPALRCAACPSVPFDLAISAARWSRLPRCSQHPLWHIRASKVHPSGREYNVWPAQRALGLLACMQVEQYLPLGTVLTAVGELAAVPEATGAFQVPHARAQLHCNWGWECH